MIYINSYMNFRLYHDAWPCVTLKGEIKVKLKKKAHYLVFTFSKSLIFGLKWLWTPGALFKKTNLFVGLIFIHISHAISQICLYLRNHIFEAYRYYTCTDDLYKLIWTFVWHHDLSPWVTLKGQIKVTISENSILYNIGTC